MENKIVFVMLALCAGLTFASFPFQDECVSGRYPPSKDREVPWEVINLDLPPIQRWNALGSSKKAQLQEFIGYIKKFITDWTKSDFLIKAVDKELPLLAATMRQPFRDELASMANGSGIPLGEIVLYNIFYEIFTVCTSIVAEDAKGTLYHARNLDFGLFMGWDWKNHTWQVTEYLRPLVMNINYTRGGKVVFKSTSFAGYIGVLTGMQPGIFTLTMNERFNIDGGYIGFVEWIMGKRDGWWMGFLTRHVLETAVSYDDAQEILANTTMLAPAYFILGGNSTGQGSVITRSREKAVDIWDMKTIQNHTWYILETNYDHWEKPLFLDDRRTPANKCMMQKGSAAMGFSAIFDVLSSRPVLNKLTTYSALMQVNSGAMETYLQYCPEPCIPW